MEILGILMFRWMEVLNLTPIGAAVVVFVVTIVAGAIVGRTIVNVAGYPNAKAIIGAIVAGSVAGMVLVIVTVGSAIIGAIFGAIGGGIFAAIAGTRKDAILKTIIGGAVAGAAMLGGAIIGSSGNAGFGLIAGAIAGGAIGGAIGGIIVSSIFGGAIGSKNSGITLLCGVPYWYVYKINGITETLVYWNEVKGPQCKWPQGYFGVEGIPVVWDPSAGLNYGNLDVGPQKEGKYEVVVMVRTGGGFNSSESTIITVK
jgi:hypothetical protein